MITLGLTFCFYIETPAKLDFLLFRHFERSENEVSAKLKIYLLNKYRFFIFLRKIIQ